MTTTTSEIEINEQKLVRAEQDIMSAKVSVEESKDAVVLIEYEFFELALQSFDQLFEVSSFCATLLSPVKELFEFVLEKNP